MASRFHHWLAPVLSTATALVGVVVLLGWCLHIDALKTVVPGFVSMKANTALCFLALGVGTTILGSALRARPLARRVVDLLAGAVALVAALSVLEYVVGASFGLDEFLFKDPILTTGTSHPGRMAPNTGLDFVFLAVALLLLRRGPKAVAIGQIVVLGGLLLSVVAMVGYFFEANLFVTVASLTRMALHTIAAFLCLGFAMLFVRGDFGFMSVILGDSPGGFIARRLLPSLALPLVLGLVVQIGQQSGLYDSGFALALLSIASIVALSALVWISARQLNDAEKLRLKSVAEQMKATVREQTALEASRLKSEFLANMSHEIRTPMNGVVGMTSMLLDTPLSEPQRDYVETIRTSGDSLLTIINDILDFSKIEAGRMLLEQNEFNLHECIEQAFDVLAFRAHQKNLELIYNIDDTVPVWVLGDGLRLRQVLINLVGNAVKFTEKGEIVLRVALRRAEQALEIEFILTDTGIGMNHASLQLLFQSFSQVDSSPTRRHGGTGLGLVISKRLVELMGGAISVESEAGRGSTFRFTTLVKPLGLRDNAEIVSPSVSHTPTRLLIVDDNATNLFMLQSQLKARGFNVTTANSAAEALALVHTQEPFAAVITDMQMPEMDGILLALRLRNEPTTAHLPVILLSSAANLPDGLPTDLFVARLLKPAKLSQLLAAITRAIFPGIKLQVEPIGAVPVPRILNQRFPLTILVAEDNLVNQKVISQLLLRMGFHADVAINGEEAVLAAERTNYDLVLMDIQMPVMDGFEAMRAIRRQPGHVPQIIAVTANALAEDRSRLLAAGFDDYISKPIPVLRLEEMIERQGQLILSREGIS